MSGGTAITVIGNLTADPVLRSTGSGTALARFTIASTPRTLDPRTGKWVDGGNCLRGRHGMARHRRTRRRVPGQGHACDLHRNPQARSYTTKTGEMRTIVELEVEDIVPFLRHTTAVVTRTGPGPEQDEEQPPDRFSLSPREYADGDPWFGLAANPAGHINVPAPDAEPVH